MYFETLKMTQSTTAMKRSTIVLVRKANRVYDTYIHIDSVISNLPTQ